MEIKDKYNIQLIRSKRRSLQIEISSSCIVIVRAPLKMSEKDIYAFVEEKQGWIDKALIKAKNNALNKEELPKLYSKDLRELTIKARKVIPGKVKEYAEKIGVSYTKITIRHQKSRWGSCSSKGNLNFNCLLMLTPDEVVDYVVVHELCHRLHMNHSKEFWNEVERVMPDYKTRRKWLKDNGNAIIERVHVNE